MKIGNIEPQFELGQKVWVLMDGYLVYTTITGVQIWPELHEPKYSLANGASIREEYVWDERCGAGMVDEMMENMRRAMKAGARRKAKA